MTDIPENPLFEAVKQFKLDAIQLTDQIRNTKLLEMRVLDAIPEKIFDDVVALVATVCGTNAAILTFVGAERSFVKAALNLPIGEEPRYVSFCNHLVTGNTGQVMIVHDATNDERFAQNPKVLSGYKIRFYAGAPIVTEDGVILGAICAIDNQEKSLREDQIAALVAISGVVRQILEGRKR